MTKQKVTITPQTTLAQVLQIPGALEVLQKYAVPCIVCPLAGAEMYYLTLEAIAKAYGLDLQGLLKELEKLVSKARSAAQVHSKAGSKARSKSQLKS